MPSFNEVGVGWTYGYLAGAAVVLAVALLVLSLIILARRIGSVAEEITNGLSVTRKRTEALWSVDVTNSAAGDILDGAGRARQALGGGDPVSRTRSTSPPRHIRPVEMIQTIESR